MAKPCSNCGDPLIPHRNSLGMCGRCYNRWDRAGRPDTGPPPPQAPTWTDAARASAKAARTEAFEANLRQLAYLIDTGMPLKAAARRMRIAIGTAYRYAAVLREREEVKA
jgi:hypothetical protein